MAGLDKGEEEEERTRSDLVPGLLRDAVFHCHSPDACRWPPEGAFVSSVDPDVRAGAVLAGAVYLPPGEMMRAVKQFDRRILKIDEPELDRAGESQFAFFCRMTGPSPVTWTVARGTSTSTWDDLFIDVVYLFLGRPWANPDFHKLLRFHDACCEDTEAMGSIRNFRRIAVGHSKAGAEVAELALARGGVEAHAFNDGGALNLNVLDLNPFSRRGSAAADGMPNVTCHRIRGDLLSALRLPIGTTRYYAKDPAQLSPHSMANFSAAEGGAVPRLATEALLAWPATLFVARTRDLLDEETSVLHPTQHAVLAAGTWLSCAPFEGPAMASRFSLWVFLRSICTMGSPLWQSCKVAAMSAAEAACMGLERWEAAAVCGTEACAAWCCAAGHSRSGAALQIARGCLLQHAAVHGRLAKPSVPSLRSLREALAPTSVMRHVGPHVGQRLGMAVWLQAAAVCRPLPLLGCSTGGSCAAWLDCWVSRELAAAVGAQLGARFFSNYAGVLMSIYLVPVCIATFSLTLRRML